VGKLPIFILVRDSLPPWPVHCLPKTFLRLFEGKNFGKRLLKIADPPLGGTN
jgi:hypothetical protein